MKIKIAKFEGVARKLKLGGGKKVLTKAKQARGKTKGRVDKLGKGKPRGKKGSDGLSHERTKHYRQKIDEALARGDMKAANDARYERYSERKKNLGQKPRSRERWDESNERMRQNRSQGYAQEPKGREALEGHLGRKLENNNEGTVTMHTADGKTTRPDSIGRNSEGKIDVVHDHKHLTGEGDQVVYDTDQMRAQRKMIETDDGKHIVTMSSDKPNLTGASPQPRPSEPLGEKSDVYYADPKSGKVTHQWDTDSKSWIEL